MNKTPWNLLAAPFAVLHFFSAKKCAKYFPQERLCITTDDLRLHTFQPHRRQSGCNHFRGDLWWGRRASTPQQLQRVFSIFSLKSKGAKSNQFSVSTMQSPPPSLNQYWHSQRHLLNSHQIHHSVTAHAERSMLCNVNHWRRWAWVTQIWTDWREAFSSKRLRRQR